MLSFKVNVSKALDTKKIQEAIAKTDVNILVGFPSGEQHVETFHKDESGNYVTYDGNDPIDAQPIDNDELAKILSYGADNIPPRPFLEEGIESKKAELAKAMQEQADKAMNDGNANWGKVGTMAVGAIQEFVRSDFYKTKVPNSEKTINYKGSDTPLIDGGNLVQSVQFIVQEKDR